MFKRLLLIVPNPWIDLVVKADAWIKTLVWYTRFKLKSRRSLV